MGIRSRTAPKGKAGPYTARSTPRAEHSQLHKKRLITHVWGGTCIYGILLQIVACCTCVPIPVATSSELQTDKPVHHTRTFLMKREIIIPSWVTASGELFPLLQQLIMMRFRSHLLSPVIGRRRCPSFSRVSSAFSVPPAAASKLRG